MRTLFYPCLLLLIACGRDTEREQPVDMEAEKQALMETSREWAKSTTPEAYLQYWDTDARVMGDGEPTYRGHEEIRKMLGQADSIPGFEISWEPLEAEVSECGDMGYLLERTALSMLDSTGSKQTFHKRSVTIWRKQQDGSWKNVVDIYNDDPSLTGVE